MEYPNLIVSHFCCRTDMPEEEIREIIQDIPIPESKPAEVPVPVATAGGLTEPERRVRALKKKLTQIDKIREKKAKGEKLEKNQVNQIINTSNLTQLTTIFSDYIFKCIFLTENVCTLYFD